MTPENEDKLHACFASLVVGFLVFIVTVMIFTAAVKHEITQCTEMIKQHQEEAR